MLPQKLAKLFGITIGKKTKKKTTRPPHVVFFQQKFAIIYQILKIRKIGNKFRMYYLLCCSVAHVLQDK